jgi:cytoskeletal protein RodZ
MYPSTPLHQHRPYLQSLSVLLSSFVLVTILWSDRYCHSFTVSSYVSSSIRYNTDSSSSQRSSTTTDAATTATTIQTNDIHHTLEPPISMQELLTVHHNTVDTTNMELSKAQELYNSVVQTTYGYVQLCTYVCLCMCFLWYCCGFFVKSKRSRSVWVQGWRRWYRHIM